MRRVQVVRRTRGVGSFRRERCHGRGAGVAPPDQARPGRTQSLLTLSLHAVRTVGPLQTRLRRRCDVSQPLTRPWRR